MKSRFFYWTCHASQIKGIGQMTDFMNKLVNVQAQYNKFWGSCLVF
jgi:hypothetical protein